MKRLISAVLLLPAFLMFMGGVFVIAGMMGGPNVSLAILLSLGAQFTVVAAGYLTAPVGGKIGFFRGLAVVFCFLHAAALPVALFALYSWKFKQLELMDSDQLVWSLTTLSTGLALFLVSFSLWYPSASRRSADYPADGQNL
jgi:hypothetical protein